MTILSHDPHNTETDHPDWCAPPFCESAHPHDRRHATVPVLLDTLPLSDTVVSLSLVRDDEFVPRTKQWLESGPAVLLRLRDLGSVTPSGDELDVEALLSRDTIRRLIAELTAFDAQVWGEDRVCIDCGVSFAWDESPDDQRCAPCAEQADWRGGAS